MAVVNKKPGLKLTLAVLLIPWIIAGGPSTMTAVQDMANAFPHLPYSRILLVTTLPNIPMVAASVLAGIVIGKRLRFKTHLIIAALLVIISGVMPFILKDFTAILISRAAYGLGLGFYAPINNAYIFTLYDGDERVRIMGINTASMFFGTVVNTLLGGLLCTLSWRATFLVHLLAIAPLIIVYVILPNPPLISRTPESGKTRALPVFPMSCYMFFILSFVFSTLFFPLSIGMSSIVTQTGLGNSSTTGIILSCNTIAGAVAGLLFGFAIQRVGRLMLPMSIALCAAGMGIVYFAASLPLVVIGAFISGVGSASNALSITAEVGKIIPREDVGAFSGINMSASSIGMFCTTLYTSIIARTFGEAVKTPLIVSFVGLILLLIIVLASQASNRLRSR